MENHAIRKSALTGACALVVMGSLSFARSWLLGSWIGGAGAANPIASAFSPGNASLSTSGAALLVLLVLPFSSLLFGYEAGRLARNALHRGGAQASMGRSPGSGVGRALACGGRPGLGRGNRMRPRHPGGHGNTPCLPLALRPGRSQSRHGRARTALDSEGAGRSGFPSAPLRCATSGRRNGREGRRSRHSPWQRERASASATTQQLVCSCRIDAGHCGVTAPSIMSWTAWALSAPVAATTIMRACMIVWTPIV